MDLSYCPYNLLYNTNDGERNKIFELTLIAPGYNVYDIEKFFEYAQDVEDNNIDELIDEIIELPIYNGNNELVKIFNWKMLYLFRKW